MINCYFPLQYQFYIMPIEEKTLKSLAAQSIVTDFQLDEADESLAGRTDLDLDRLRKMLISEVDYLVTHNMERLKSILYRIDVDEQKLHQALSEGLPSEAPEIIVDMIIEREMQKAETREKYRRGEL